MGGKTARRRAASSAGARGCEDAVAPSSAAAHCHGRAAAPARGGCIHRGSGAPAGWPVGSRRTRQLVEKERGGTRRGRAGRRASALRGGWRAAAEGAAPRWWPIEAAVCSGSAAHVDAVGRRRGVWGWGGGAAPVLTPVGRRGGRGRGTEPASPGLNRPPPSRGWSRLASRQRWRGRPVVDASACTVWPPLGVSEPLPSARLAPCRCSV